MKSLKEYSRKRNFAVTSEPPAASTKSKSKSKTKILQPGEQASYFVQRHDASHLHYDFRLEIEGVLKSWAVPKGPSLDPSEKRLAMMVEDHPLSYGTFEGNIPQGEYGGGSVMLWDRGSFTLLGSGPADEQLAEGNLKFSMEGSKLHGEFALVRLNSKAGNEWLLIKKKDAGAKPGWKIGDYESSVTTGRSQDSIAKNLQPAREQLPKLVEPMLALLTDRLPEGSEWIYEIKWDGMRALCQISSRGVDFQSRSGGSYSRHFPELKSIGASIQAKEAVLDGEIVAVDENGVSHFEWLQPRFADPGTKPVKSQGSGRIVYCVFDLLFLDGQDLRDLPLSARSQRLSEIIAETGELIISKQFSGEPIQVMKAAEDLGIEGVVAKRVDSHYRAGRSDVWRKVKLELRQEFLICGWLEGKRKSFGSLVLGLNEGKALKWCGNVGTGFDEQTMTRLAETMQARRLKKGHLGTWPKGMIPIRPDMICEVKFAQWTAAGKLRAPVFLGLRADVKPNEVRRESLAGKKMIAGKDANVTLDIDGHQLQFTNLDKLYFPEDGLTKRDVLNYYAEVSPYLLPMLEDRPLSLKRYPDGILGKTFFQKNLPESTPEWIDAIKLYSDDSKRMIRYCLCANLATLLYLVNLGCIDHHPWLSRVNDLDSPDSLLIDLDGNGAPFGKVVEGALAMKELIEEVGLSSVVKTSGGDGVHVLIPLEPKQNYDRVKQVAEQLAQVAAARYPKLFTIERAIAKRPKSRVYIDYLQVGKGKTVASAYSIRPHANAPVSTPLLWDELTTSLKPGDFNLGNMPIRLEQVGDVWGGNLTRYRLGS